VIKLHCRADKYYKQICAASSFRGGKNVGEEEEFLGRGWCLYYI